MELVGVGVCRVSVLAGSGGASTGYGHIQWSG